MAFLTLFSNLWGRIGVSGGRGRCGTWCEAAFSLILVHCQASRVWLMHTQAGVCISHTSDQMVPDTDPANAPIAWPAGPGGGWQPPGPKGGPVAYLVYPGTQLVGMLHVLYRVARRTRPIGHIAGGTPQPPIAVCGNEPPVVLGPTIQHAGLHGVPVFGMDPMWAWGWSGRTSGCDNFELGATLPPRLLLAPQCGAPAMASGG